MTAGWITRADRVRWQQRAAAELAAILAAHPDMPVIAWTVTTSGGVLSGQMLTPAEARRSLFTEWRQALRLNELTETQGLDGTPGYRHASGVRGGVSVSLAATVFDNEEESR